MDVMILLERAKSAGLTVEAQGARLLVKGPKRAATIIQELGRQKTAVLAVLSAKSSPTATASGGGKVDAGRKQEPAQTARQCATVRRSTEECRAPSMDAPVTIAHDGETYDVAVKNGIRFFRRSPEAGWTACSDDFTATIEEQLRRR